MLANFLIAAQALQNACPWFWPLVGAVFGAVIGSFINCALYRVPRGLSMRHPPSQCPSCKTRLGVPDLVPVFSWLWLRGACRHCGARIPALSLLVEIACAALGAASASFFITG